MATIVRGDIPSSEFALQETLSTLPDLEVEIERIVTSGDASIMPLLWVRGADANATQQALQNDSSVETIELLSTFDNEQLYRMEWIDRIQLVLQMLTNAQASILDAHGSSDQWQLRVLFPDRDELTMTTDFCGDHGLTFTIKTIRELDGELSGRYGLTDVQHESLIHAVETGYYEVPRNANLADLANDLDISHQALSERLRRATQALIEDALLVGPQSDD